MQRPLTHAFGDLQFSGEHGGLTQRLPRHIFGAAQLSGEHGGGATHFPALQKLGAMQLYGLQGGTHFMPGLHTEEIMFRHKSGETPMADKEKE